MTTERFLPVYFSIPVSHFNSAFDDAFLISYAVCAHLTFDRWSNPSESCIVYIFPLLFNRSNAFRGQVRFHHFVIIDELVQFIHFERRTRIAIFTATTLTFVEVAYKLLLHN